MWFWSVSWSTNCPVYFSLFMVDQKKIVQSQGIFGQALIFFGPPSFFLVYQNFFLVYQKIRAWPKKFRDWPKIPWDWTNFFLVNQKKWEIDRTIGRPRDWPKPHGRDCCVHVSLTKDSSWFNTCTLLFYRIEPLKNGPSLILPSSIARNSSAPNAKRIFQIHRGILEGCTNRVQPSRPSLKNCQNGTF